MTTPSNTEDNNITMQDLATMHQIITTASKRGAFTDPVEYSPIGGLFVKINAILKEHEEAVKAANEVSQHNTNKDKDA